MQRANDDYAPASPATHPTFRRPLLRAIAGAGTLGVLGVPHVTHAVRAAIDGVEIDYKRCKVAFVSNASAIDTIAVYYADRHGDRAARYDITPTTTNPRGYAPLVVEYDPDEDRTQIQLAEPKGSLVCVIAETDGDRTVVTNPTAACVPTGFNTEPSASFDVSDDPTVGEPVTFSSTATDPDAPERLFDAWDLDDDGVFEASGETATSTFETPGEKTIRHRVTDDCGATDTATRTITVSSSALFAQVAKLTAGDGEAGDIFGSTVSIDGDTALVGAYLDDDQGLSAGAAYVLERHAGGANVWGAVRKLTASDGRSGNQFGRSVSVAGDTVVIGSSGNAYVFDRNAGGSDAWGQVTTLTASDSVPTDAFGTPVSVDGDTAIVGASLSDAMGFNSGAAYVFARNQGGPDAWGEIAKLTPRTDSREAAFGSAINITGDTAIIGAPGSMAAYVFERDLGGADAWGEAMVLTPPERRLSFGYAVGLDGDTALVGSFLGPAVSVYGRDVDGPDAWGEVTTLTASDSTSNRFGFALSLAGDTALVGAFADAELGTLAGAAYVFDRNHGGDDAWGEISKLTATDGAPGDLFGSAVSIDAGTALIGASGDNAQSGAAYIFE